MYAKADFEDDETRRLIFEYFIDKIYVFDDKLIIDMYYSDNHIEVSLDAFYSICVGFGEYGSIKEYAL